MTSLIAQPQLLATAAADASEISSAISAAKAAAAGPTTGVVAAAEDEVSAVTAAFFGAYGQEYQALLQRAAMFHDQFAATFIQTLVGEREYYQCGNERGLDGLRDCGSDG
jgi:hypothetical protein